MTEKEFQAFSSFRDDFKKMVCIWNQNGALLKTVQEAAQKKGKTPHFDVETPVVYNTALDEITEKSEIKVIVIGDNPGKDEQKTVNQKYLVGQAGKLGERFFRMNPELNVDFRKNAIILNKTPVHSAKTNQLKFMEKDGGPAVKKLIDETQEWMALQIARLHMALPEARIYLVGYAELKPGKIFSLFRDTLKNQYKNQEDWNRVLVFQHFSMNRFTIDLDAFKKQNSEMPLNKLLQTLGMNHRDEIFGKPF